MITESKKYLTVAEVLDMHRILLRMFKLNLITKDKALDIITNNLKMESLGYRNIEGLYREQWRLPGGEIVTFSRQFDSEIWADIK